MGDCTRVLLVGLIVLLTHCLEGITGFGCTVLALPFVAMLLGIKTAVPVLVVLAWLLAGYIIVRSWRSICWREFGYITFFVVMGLPAGMFLFDYCPPMVLDVILAAFMILVGLHGWRKTRRSSATSVATCTNNDRVSPDCCRANGLLEANQDHAILSCAANACHISPSNNQRSWLLRGVLMLGGVIHGAFGTGGPFVVVYATKALPEKTLFRVTLCLLWFSLNSMMIIKWILSGGVWGRTTLQAISFSLPFLIVGILLGDWLHHKVNEYYFRLTVYAVLAMSGIVMALSIGFGW